jgi:hypothetical protein
MSDDKVTRKQREDALRNRYRARAEARARRVGEPENAGRSLEGYVALSADVAGNYEPGGYLKTAPKPK